MAKSFTDIKEKQYEEMKDYSGENKEYLAFKLQ